MTRKTIKLSSRPILFLTCEHAGNQIPVSYKKLFAKNRGVLKSHRGLDTGAFAIAKRLSGLTKTKLYFTTVSRLIVDMNRSPFNDSALSKWTKRLPAQEQQNIFEKIYWPYRKQIFRDIDSKMKSQPVAHFGIHSFSPYIDESRKSCDIGILFDPKFPFEKQVAHSLQKNLKRLFPDLGIKMNFPYRGDADGLTTSLRAHYRGSKKTPYAGIEIEMNQALLKKLALKGQIATFTKNLATSIKSTLADLDPQSNGV